MEHFYGLIRRRKLDLLLQHMTLRIDDTGEE